MPVHLLAVDEGGVAHSHDLDLLHHPADDHGDVLVVDLDALQPVHLLHLVHQIALQLVLAEDLQDVVRIYAAVAQQVARLHGVAVAHQQVLAHRHRVLVLLVPGIDHADRTLALGNPLELHQTADLGEHRRRLRAARFEQLADPRQAAGDVAGLDALLQQLGHHAAGGHLVAFLHVEIGLARQVVARDFVGFVLPAGRVLRRRRRVDHDDARLQRLGRHLGDLLLHLAGVGVDLFLEVRAGDVARHDVLEPHPPRHLGDDRLRERVEVGNGLIRRHHLAHLNQQRGAVAHLHPLGLRDDQNAALAPRFMEEDEAHVVGLHRGAAAAQDLDLAEHLLAILHQHLIARLDGYLLNHLVHHQIALAAEQQVAILAGHRGAVHLAHVHRIAQVDAVLLTHLGGAADVERTHGELRARLADRLGGDDPHRLADLDRAVGGQVAPVALLAHPLLRLAGQHGADAHRLHANALDPVRDVVGNLLVYVDENLAGNRMAHPLQGELPGDAVAQRLDDLLAILDRALVDAVDGAAVHLVHHHVLGDVDQPPGQVAGVGGLQRGVRQPLAGAVGGDEELGDVEAVLEAGANRQLDDVA